MTLMDLQRRARDAAASARRNLVPGTVKAVHNGDSELARLAGSTPGQPLYTVTARGRRGQEYDLFPVASPIPVQVGHKVFLSFLDGDLSRGAWITGLTHPPVPQVVNVEQAMAGGFSDHIETSPTPPPMPGVNRRLWTMDEALVVTSAQTRLAFTLRLPVARGSHQVTLSGLTLWDGSHSVSPNHISPHVVADHDDHLIIKAARLTGGLGGPVVQWDAEVRLLDGATLLGISSYPWTAQAVITGGTVVDDTTRREREWTFDDQLLTPAAAWSDLFNTSAVMGKKVTMELYLIGTFVNPNEYALPWDFVGPQFLFKAVEVGYGSGLPDP